MSRALTLMDISDLIGKVERPMEDESTKQKLKNYFMQTKVTDPDFISSLYDAAEFEANGNYKGALVTYYRCLRIALYSNMRSIDNATVKEIQECRFRVYRKMRAAK